jgi:hypothetical protein
MGIARRTLARRGLARRGLALAAGLWLAAALGLAPGFVPGVAPAPVAAASPGLTITSVASYDVIPDEGRVAVTAKLTATNHLKNTITRQLSFRTAYLTVQPGTSEFRLTGKGAPNLTVREATDTFTTLRLDLGENLEAGKSTSLTLAFNIRDAGGEPDRAVRISPSLVSFAAWAFATPNTPGSSIAVQLPTGYQVTIGRGPLAGPVAGEAGHDLWTSGVLAAPLEFVADIAADRPVTYAEKRIDVPLTAGSATVLVHSWPDDSAWSDRVANLVQHALPILEREIGVEWRLDAPLAVNEALELGSGGFAGVFDPAERRIDISYAASDTVVIHELAHAWFNGRLVADRWAAEGFASYYAELATRELGLDIRPPDAVEPGVGSIPLNAWGASDTESPETDQYAYAASAELARQIALRAGADGLRNVWSRAARGIGAYQPDPAAEETVDGAPDWRGLLDLLVDQTGQDFADLWRRWVARPQDLEALDGRASTRAAYEQAVQLAGDWRLPISIRNAMRTWRFDVASNLLAAAHQVLGQRATLGAAAAAAGAKLPDSLRNAFEGTDGLAAAAAEAAAEQSALETIAAATSAQGAGQSFPDALLSRVGLLGRDPAVELGAAKVALLVGDVAGAHRTAQSAHDAWLNAASVGRGRIVSLVLLVVALGIFVALARGARRRELVEST